MYFGSSFIAKVKGERKKNTVIVQNHDTGSSRLPIYSSVHSVVHLYSHYAAKAIV